MKLFSLFLLLLGFSSIYGQQAIAVGEAAPEINVTEWLANAPENESLAGKAIVLEFWATWCGPCLDAVPHLNELQEQYGGEDLLFLSMTDEPASLAKPVLKRIPFASAVVTDETKQTQIAFGDGKKGLTTFPLTVLIDDKGVIRWIGEPKALNGELLEGLVSGSIEPENEQDEQDEQDQEEGGEAGYSRFLELVKNKEVESLLEFTENEDGLQDWSMIMGPTKVFFAGATLKEVLHHFKPGVQVELPEEYVDKAYSLYYLKRSAKTVDWPELEAEILEETGLQKQEKKEVVTALEFKVIDQSKLEVADVPFSAQSEMDDGRVMFTGFSLADLAESFGAYNNSYWQAEEAATERYSFLIDVTSTESILEDLMTYGVSIDNKQRIVEVWKFTE